MARSMRAPATTAAFSASPGAGKGEEYYATGQSNVTGLMIDQQGRLLAGTEPNGILYRITAKDKAFVLYDSSLPEIRAVSPNRRWQHLRGRAGRIAGEEGPGRAGESAGQR